MAEESDVGGTGRPQLAELFARALELSNGERERFLDAACAEHPALRRELEELLAADGQTGGFLDQTDLNAWVGIDRESDAPSPGPMEDSDPLPGSVIGQYRILHRIGAGGMSTVYLAERIGGDFPMTVAVKLIKRGLETDEVLRRFLNERRVLASLVHENIARVIDGGATPDGRPFLMMDYVEGEPIDRYCSTRSLRVRERLELFRVVCAAVTHAHRSLVIHRDLKPANIMVTREGSVRLLDFGIAKLLDPGEHDAVGLTRTGARLMTPRYASPEQVRGEPATTATDVYSLGVILYELLTGRHPYRMDQPSGVLERQICESPPPPPSTAVRQAVAATGSTTDTATAGIDTRKLARRLEGDLDVIVLKALRKEPERRYGSVEQLSEDIRRHLAGLPVLARPDTFLYRSNKYVRRNAGLVGGSVVVVSLLVTFAVLMAQQLRQTRLQRDRADLEGRTARQTVEFLEGLFQVPDPGTARGRSITAREILEHGATRLRTSFDDRPLVRARLLRTIGGVQINLGLYDEARPNIESALETCRQTVGVDSLELATAIESLANLRRISGDTPGALALAEEALGIRERSPQRNDIQLSVTLSRVAILHTRQRDFASARSLLERALALREAEQGPDHPDMAPTLHSLASVHLNLGELQQADALYQRALGMLTTSLGPGHPQLAGTLSSLSAVASELGQHARAESLQTRALELNIEALGPEHDAVGGNLADLALLRKNAGDPAGALEPATRAVVILEKSLGSDHPVLASALLTLGQVLALTGDSELAMARGRQALRIMERKWPPDHPQVIAAHRLVEASESQVMERGSRRAPVPTGK